MEEDSDMGCKEGGDKPGDRGLLQTLACTPSPPFSRPCCGTEISSICIDIYADGPVLSTRAERVCSGTGGKTIRVSVTKWGSNCRLKGSDYKISNFCSGNTRINSDT